MGFKVVKYNDFNDREKSILLKRSEDGWNFPIAQSALHDRLILINDSIQSDARRQATILHEIKHIINYDTKESDYNEDMADYFARYIKCPIPYLIFIKEFDKLSIMYKYDVSSQMAQNVESNIKKRHKKYGWKIFRNEIPILKQILGDDYDEDKIDFVD
jgi:Zn-dependent peptidase ImmA (M78 family)